jgi:hypothetical protein
MTDAYTSHLLTALISFVCAGGGAYFGSYFKKKGENLATHEDINKLVDQVRAVTTTTKEIEAKIDDKFWNRQRLWELKRDSILAAIQAMDRAKASLVVLWAARTPKASALDPLNTKRRQESEEEWLTAINEFDRTRSNISFVCGQSIRTEMAQISHRVRITGSLIFKDKLSDREFVDLGTELKQRITKIHASARIELGITLTDEETANNSTSQSKGSLAAPTPD